MRTRGPCVPTRSGYRLTSTVPSRGEWESSDGPLIGVVVLRSVTKVVNPFGVGVAVVMLFGQFLAVGLEPQFATWEVLTAASLLSVSSRVSGDVAESHRAAAPPEPDDRPSTRPDTVGRPCSRSVQFPSSGTNGSEASASAS